MLSIVKKLREELNLSQSKFAKVAGFNSFQQVSNLENMRQNVGLGLINKMVNNLNQNGHEAQLIVKVRINGKSIRLKI
ncbi:helix-turn-helix domain-containing protein [Aquirufa regiilacus]